MLVYFYNLSFPFFYLFTIFLLLSFSFLLFIPYDIYHLLHYYIAKFNIRVIQVVHIMCKRLDTGLESKMDVEENSLANLNTSTL